MHTVEEKIVTAEMKITRADGTVEIHEVELDAESQRQFLIAHEKEKANARSLD